MSSSDRRRCKCNWPDCTELCLLFKKNNDRCYGHRLVKVQIEATPSKSKSLKYKSGILVNLGIDEKQIKYDDRIARIDIARHHWAEKSLDYFFQSNHLGSLKKRPSTALPSSVIQNISDFSDPRFSYNASTKGRGGGTEKGPKLFFICPNQPRSHVLTYARTKYGYTSGGIHNISTSVLPLQQDTAVQVPITPPLTSRITLLTSSCSTNIDNFQCVTRSATKTRLHMESLQVRSRSERAEKRNETREATAPAVEDKRLALMNDNAEQRLSDNFNSLTFSKYKKVMEELKTKKLQLNQLEVKFTNLSGQHDILKKSYNLMINKKRRLEQNKTSVKRYRMENVTPSRVQLYEKKIVEQRLTDTVASIGGLSHYTITSDSFHSENPSYANLLFGIPTWHETKEYIKLFFGVQHSPLSINIGGQLKPMNVTDFEQIVIALIFLHSFTHRSKLAIIFNKSRRSISRYLVKWLPQWGKIGEFLSILPMFPDYFGKEIPNIYGAQGFDKVGAMLDGKDALIETIRKNDLLKRSGHSSKMKAQAWRIIVWVTPMGLTFEHTRAMGGRCDENELVRTHSILGRSNGPVLEWKNYARKYPVRKALNYWTAADDILTYSEVTKANSDAIEHELERDNSAGVLRDEMSATEGERQTEQESILLKVKLSTKHRLPDPKKHGFATACKMLFRKRLAMKNAEKVEVQKEVQNISETKRQSLDSILTVSGRRALQKKIAGKNPQNDPEEFLQQIELLEHLHCSYENKTLSKNVLSAYLHMTQDHRRVLLTWMGSSLFPDSLSPDEKDIPAIPLRLHKIPGDRHLLGDKGFRASHGDYPNANVVHTPETMNNLPIYQYHEAEGNRKNKLCSLCWISEGVNTRLIKLDALKDKITYKNLSIQPYAIEWGHALINLGKPFRQPGANCGLPANYWE